MATVTVNITKIVLTPTPATITTCRVYYRCHGSTGSYTTVSTNISVNTDGTLVSPLSFTYDDTVCTTGIELKADAACGGTAYVISAECIQWSIYNNDVKTNVYQYTGCDGVFHDSVTISAGDTHIICALRTPQVTSFTLDWQLTITAIGSCAAGTTSTSTTSTTTLPPINFIVNMSSNSNKSLDGITVESVPPTLISGTDVPYEDGIHNYNVATGTVTIHIDYTPTGPLTRFRLVDSAGNVQCVNAAASEFNFSSVIINNTTPCVLYGESSTC